MNAQTDSITDEQLGAVVGGMMNEPGYKPKGGPGALLVTGDVGTGITGLGQGVLYGTISLMNEIMSIEAKNPL